jgi:hypothetical protein
MIQELRRENSLVVVLAFHVRNNSPEMVFGVNPNDLYKPSDLLSLELISYTERTHL